MKEANHIVQAVNHYRGYWRGGKGNVVYAPDSTKPITFEQFSKVHQSMTFHVTFEESENELLNLFK